MTRRATQAAARSPATPATAEPDGISTTPPSVARPRPRPRPQPQAESRKAGGAACDPGQL